MTHRREPGLVALSVYTDLTPREYYGSVLGVNRNTRNSLRRDISNFIEQRKINLNNCCFIIGGSDGKGERHAQSKTEVTILVRDPSLRNLGADFLSWYEKYPLRGRPFASLFDLNPNTHLPDVRIVRGSAPPGQQVPDSEVLSYAFGERSRVYPDRILNAQGLLGNEDILLEAKRQVLEEMTTPPNGKRIRTEMKEQLAGYRKALADGPEQGVYHKHRAFSEKPPIQLYSEESDTFTVGFKIPALRSVQRALDIFTAEAVMHNRLPINDAAQFPTDTIGRIEALRQKGLISAVNPSLTAEVMEAYGWFLQQYHAIQDMYHKRQLTLNSSRAKVPIHLQFSAEDFRKHQKSIVSFVDQLRGK